VPLRSSGGGRRRVEGAALEAGAGGEEAARAVVAAEAVALGLRLGRVAAAELRVERREVLVGEAPGVAVALAAV